MKYNITWGIRIFKYSWIYCSLFIISSQFLYSEIKITINDTTLSRGKTSQIFIYGTVTDDNISKFKLILEYNTLNLYIHSASGAGTYSMKCANPTITTNLDDLTNSRVTITCNDIQKVENGIICVLNVEGLAGPDSTSVIKLDSVFINDTYLEMSDKDSGLINVPGLSVIQKYPEGIGFNFPNPFYEDTKFPISIHELTNVKFKVYSLDGRFVFSNEQTIDMLELSFYKNNIEVPISNLNQKLDQGSYMLKLKPDNMQFAGGEYYLIMITDNGVYHRNFIYMK